MASSMDASSDIRGILSPVIITSFTCILSLSPREPDGWFFLKSFSLKFLSVKSTTARASPTARADVVLAVGARPRAQASFFTPVSIT